MKHIFLAVVSVALIGFIGVTIYQYQTQPKPVAGETVQQAMSATSKVSEELKQHDAVAQAALNNANSIITSLTGQKVALCGQLKNNKLVNTLCN